ncbi:amidinotransferase [Glycomyces sp. L485]|uniref:dimethylargininase n=1 Tax=Glycomyces sp. L485 TaxID=2909235 RepID=UPI001F4B3921|nr:dimethylargininase [Glycomyces sp. L485]MCH7229521.1 amidinotransferase [Glycomyces sp. L485]
MAIRSSSPETSAIRASRGRTYLMCRPAYYAVEYAINPWMDTSAPVDTARACAQWEALADIYADLGHEVLRIEPEPGLPDMVYAANGAFVVDGTAYGARFRHPERTSEADSHEKWHRAAGWTFVKPEHTNEGEGDFTYLPGRGLILAGWGFRTDARAHAEAADVFGRQVVSLRLVDPRYYHLDTALAPLDDERIAYYPDAFAPGSRLLLERLFPDAVLADAADAAAFGLNFVSDGTNVVVNAEAAGMVGKLRDAGYEPVPVDLSELKKGGGSVKCCTAELRR